MQNGLNYYFTDFMLIIPFLLALIVRFTREVKMKWRLTLAAPIFIISLSLFDFLFTHFQFSSSFTLSKSFALQTEFFYVNLFYSLVFFGIIFSNSEGNYSFDRFFHHLLTYGATLGFLSADNLYWLVFFYILQIYPSLVSLSQSEKLNFKKIGIFGIYQGLGVCYFIVATIILVNEGISPSVHAIAEGHYIQNTQTSLAGLLFLMSVFIGQAIFPYHSWIRAYIKKADLSTALIYLVNFGSFGILYKIVLPLLYSDSLVIYPVLTVATIFSALYWAVLALTEKNLRTIFAMILSSQTALIFTGFELGDIVGKFGSFYQWLTLILALSGFGLSLMYVENRTDIKSLKTFFGLSHKAPLLASMFFLFGFITVGLPGGMAFVGEDILFHAIIEHYPWIGIGVILTTALNAMTIYKSFCYLFHGTNESYRFILDLNKREIITLFPIIFFLLLFGLAPQLILG
ncbi:MAG: proton-conducting transporter membrane subunit [Bacteriovoracaceae bacterium]